MAGRKSKIARFCSQETSGNVIVRVTPDAHAIVHRLGIDLDDFMNAHFQQCPRRFRDLQQLETPIENAAGRALLWVATKCMRSRLFTVVFAPGEESFSGRWR